MDGGRLTEITGIYIDVFSLASSVGPDQQRLLGLDQDFNRGTEKSFWVGDHCEHQGSMYIGTSGAQSLNKACPGHLISFPIF